ncbi:Asp23/Gls24 family envelope stress response protein [Aquimarina algicola]|uniref:Transmembrane protein n=1 Tax=Aquimarina algicola TaxID=2589995 RepID=A0A504IWJ0_9FLAO|nr:hypothetical protein [Aquimarina algicola]TPN82746.1 hypothetical protein FHK87_20170 [Aquimarina algicola]
MSAFKPHIIMTEPNEMTTGLLKLKYVEKANQDIYIKTRKGILSSYIWAGLIFLGVGISLLYPYTDSPISYILFCLIPTLIGLFLIVFGLFGNKKYQKIILDRKNGIITYPDTFFRKPLTGKFKDLKVIFAVTGGEGYDTTEDLKFVNTFRPRFIAGNKTIAFGNPERAWSFYVWYMDKNRPLPPGDIFDPYRDQDFERRKAEGFPKPLYGTNIPTPEATPEQQRIREKYWSEFFPGIGNC